MNIIRSIALFIILIGALNWGSIGLLNYNFLSELLFTYPLALKSIYILIGIAAVALVLTHMGLCKDCPVNE